MKLSEGKMAKTTQWKLTGDPLPRNCNQLFQSDNELFTTGLKLILEMAKANLTDTTKGKAEYEIE